MDLQHAYFGQLGQDLLPFFSGELRAAAVELARLPLAIRGYERIKLAAVERYEAELERLRPAATR